MVYRDKEIFVSNPTEFPDLSDASNKVQEVQEPVVNASIIVPEEYLGEMMDLCHIHRAMDFDYRYLDGSKASRVLISCTLPLGEIVTAFFSDLKSRSSGYASFE